MIAQIVQHLLRHDRVAATRAKQAAARSEAAAHSTAIARILDQGRNLPDPAAAHTRRTA
ncbi:hypothetical protein CLV67_14215 [Actinoplanes italicus]|uniref:Uncharacterized protein n=1 Tax=Actinoplanes italicus TaxID=113567 RepID=A0A2T0JID0_9ACTN|nr:hypothetical protein CLV67_14215 [Actinoplanes italicus]